MSSHTTTACGALALLVMAGCSGGGAQNLVPANAAANEQSVRLVQSAAVRAPMLPSLLRGSLGQPAGGPGFISPAIENAGGAAIYLSDDEANTLTVFSSTFEVTAQLTGLGNPAGLATDALGHIYVVISGGDVISVYSHDLKTVEATLADPGEEPLDVAVDRSSGVVGVANVLGNELTAGNVVFYAKGSTTVCATVKDPKWQAMFDVAFDANGNLYVSGTSAAGKTLVGIIRGGCAATKIESLAGTNLAFPGTIKVLANGDILLDDQGRGHGSTVYQYAKPAGGAFGKPKFTTVLTDSIDAVSVDLDASETHLYAADAEASNNKYYHYPASGVPIKTFSAPVSVAPSGILVTSEAQ
jgi:hypothetical protein